MGKQYIKPDFANWPVGTKIVFAGGVRAEVCKAKKGMVVRGHKSLWLTHDASGKEWGEWGICYLEFAGRNGYEIAEVILPKQGE